MMKIRVIIGGVFCFWCIALSGAETFEKIELHKDKSLIVWLTGLSHQKNQFEISYAIQNISKHTIWLAANSDFTQKYHSSESMINKDLGELFLRVNNPTLPSSLYLYIAVSTTFKKISPGETLPFKVILQFPIYEYIFFKSTPTKALTFEELTSIKIEVGYYHDREIEGLRAIASELSREKEILINCYWAKEHPADTIMFTINQKTLNTSQNTDEHAESKQ